MISNVISDYEYEGYLLSKLKKKYDYWNLIKYQISKILPPYRFESYKELINYREKCKEE